MELRTLRSLVVLAEERHFTRAAARLHIAQPALSQQIAKLERELGLPLVDRTTRRVELTDAGRALVGRARTALAEVDAARAEMQERSGLLTGTVTIGVTRTPGPVDVPRLLAGYHRRHPGIALSVREGLSRELAGDLRADALDVAILTEPSGDALRGIERRPLAAEALVLAVAHGHRLAGRRRVRVADLRDEALIAFPPGATIRDQVEEAAAAAEFRPAVPFESGAVSRMRAKVGEGLGVAVLPRSDAERPGPAVATIALTAPTLVHRVSLARRADRIPSPAARALLADLERPPAPAA